MSGEPPSKTPKQRVDEYAARVEEYSRLRGLLPPAAQAERVRGYLTMGPEDYDDLDAEGLTALLVDVMSFAHAVQEEVSLQRVKADRCRRLIARIVEPRLSDYAVFKTEDKRLHATLDDPTALELYEVQGNCECFAARWESTLARLDGYAKAVERMIYSKGK